ncbi:MAG: hypothetical protein QOJ90_33 [Actinomycetota bacterium]|jgi:hypothetical protein|nr:hypothetical protein [Actinomycetota bacterium]
MSAARRAATAVALAGLIGIGGGTTPAFALGAQLPNEHASCQGYLASAANPNMGVVGHEFIKPLADSLGVTQGQLVSTMAADRPTQGGFPGLISCVDQLP